jgi:putative transposase
MLRKPQPLRKSAKAGLHEEPRRNYNDRVTRLRRIADHDRIFFITVRLGRGVGPLSSSERDIVLEYIAAERAAGTFQLFGYVVMPDHLHLLMAPFHAGLQDGMHRLKMRTGRRIRRIRGEHGPFWQARYFDFILRRVGDFWDKLQYIHQNPVDANLVVSPEEWPWSSAVHYARKWAVGMIDAVDLPPERSALLWPAPWR